MNEHRRLGLRKEHLSELTNHEMRGVVGACKSEGCGQCFQIHTAVNCGDLFTIATCTCPTGATCACPTEAC